MKRIILILIALAISINCISQDIVITAPKAKENNINSKSKPKKPTPSISLKLLCDLNGEKVFYTTKQWKILAEENKVKVNKIGLVVGTGQKAFLLSLYDNNQSYEPYQLLSFNEAFSKSGGQLPTNSQIQIIKQNIKAINDALKLFNNTPIKKQNYWSYDGSAIELQGNDSESSRTEEAIFRMVTTDIENGFKSISVEMEYGEKFDYEGKRYAGLSLVRHKGKYGFIDKNRNIVIPLKYDEVGCNFTNHYNQNDSYCYYGDILISVAINGKWGYVDKYGEIKVPLIYDEVPYRQKSDLMWVKVNGKFGSVDHEGNIVIPIMYDNKIEFANNNLARACINNKWGFINKNNETIIPFKYSHTRGFTPSSELAQVCIKENKHSAKYGYINALGEEKIPLQYEFADDFNYGLAGVVKNGKLGFINEHGDVVIAFTYTPEYDKDEFGDNLSFASYKYGNVAFVKNDKKYGIINNSGVAITPFKYDKIRGANNNGDFIANINKTMIYLDRRGNEYSSQSEQKKQSTELMAYQGDTRAMLDLGKKYEDKDDLNQAYNWYEKAYTNGDIESLYYLGHLMRDGEIGSVTQSTELLNKYLEYPDNIAKNKSKCYYDLGIIYFNRSHFSDAFIAFSKSNEFDAKYLMGFMYENGHGVEKDYAKAIECYKKSYGTRTDCKERIANLENLINSNY